MNSILPEPPLRNILVIEDHPASRRLAVCVLESEGYAVRAVGESESAFAAIRVAKPDLIVMDVELPGLDGIAITQTLKANSDTRRIPILAVSALALKDEEQRTRAAGADVFLTKPINIHEFAAEVARLLEESERRQ